ncbi:MULTISPECIES: prohibitin family protein [Reichenbachiella]|uniref:Regulator of protease activity HflC, stomatin/prohibitin superfamily n=1 Tax=Reichenbachiella agariperforans TaxID=156994 RepID=A0A1M6SYC3_REIAG|nr:MULTISPECIES: prohibitin family protein [Reichenbachiella]MBU2916324.1 prohibitin family protein [Reichenbachiella agariperforans]RJE75164.1 peptidase [Reichenbachiella sp. MSK19-1]SHK49660.1 Regulator of protease activity HflC, stomatin/prohibitin superfamily [Reichenbachiella agariperforans]
MDNRKLLPFVFIGAIALIVVVSLSSSLFFKVEPAERAVAFYTLTGKLDKDNIIRPGWHFKAPWTSIYTFDVSESKVEESMDVLDKNGLSINVDVSVRFTPMKDKIGEIQENFKSNYINVLVIPEVRSSVRQVMGRYTAEEIYSTKRAEVETSIKTETEKTLAAPQNNVIMKALLIRSINLPAQIKQAIENKLQQEQEALAYQFRLDKEKSEAERKRIAAEGEAQANKIVNSSLTPELLKMRGIEATQMLANSPNAKVVVIGNAKDGLPLILGNN